MVKFFLTVFLVLWAMIASAQEKTWTLPECIEYGVDHNIGVKQSALAAENSGLTLETSRYSRLPSLSANMGETFYFGRTPDRDGVYQDQTGSTASVGLNTSMTIFNGFQLNNKIKADQADLEASKEDLNKTKEMAAISVTGYYLQALLTAELLDIAQQQVEINRQQVEKAKVLVAAGKSSESELYDAQASLAEQVVAQTDAANNWKLALLDLMQAMNYQDDPETFLIATPNVDKMILGETARLWMPEDVYTSALAQRPAIKAAQYRVQGSEHTIKQAKGAYYPSLSLGAGYSNSYYYNYSLATGSRNASLADQWAQNGAESIGLSLNIPIFNKMATKNQVRAARLNYKNQQYQLDQAKVDLYKEVQQAYYNATAAQEKYVSCTQSVEAARLAFEFEQKKYEAGRSNSYDFNQVRLRLATALSQEAQAKYTFVLRSRILAYFNGSGMDELTNGVRDYFE